MEEDYGESVFSSILDRIRDFGIGRLVFILLFLFGLLYLFVLSPKPGKLTVFFKELDSNKPLLEGVDSIEVSVSSGGEPVTSCQYLFLCKTEKSKVASDGSAYFEVPPNTPITIRAEPSIHAPLVQSVTLSSGEEKSIILFLEKRHFLTITPSEVKADFGENCRKSIEVEVENKDSSAVSASFVSDNKEIEVIGAPEIIGPRERKNMKLLLSSSKKGEYSTTIRIQYTRASFKVSGVVYDRPKTSVSPSEIRCSNLKNCPNWLTIKNSGKTSLTGIQVVYNPPSLKDFLEVEDFGNKDVNPGEERKYALNYFDFPQEKFLGIISIKSECDSTDIQVTLGG